MKARVDNMTLKSLTKSLEDRADLLEKFISKSDALTMWVKKHSTPETVKIMKYAKQPALSVLRHGQSGSEQDAEILVQTIETLDSKSDAGPGYIVTRKENAFESFAESFNETRKDIMATYTKGIEITPFLESRSLSALFKKLKQKLPADIQVDIDNGYEFYIVEITFNILLEQNQFPDSASFHVTLQDDVKRNARKARAIRLFPAQKDETLFTVDLEGSVGIDAGLQISVPMENGLTILPLAKVNADATLKAKFIFGPKNYTFRRSLIKVIGENHNDILWMYVVKSELTGQNMFKSLLIVKVAKDATQLTLDAYLEIRPWKKIWLGARREELPMMRTERKGLEVELLPD